MAAKKKTPPKAPKAQTPESALVPAERTPLSSRTGIMQEIAVANPLFGLGAANFYKQRRYNPDDLIGRKGIKVYKEMRKDEQVKSALYTKKIATVASGWEISIDDTEKQDDKNLDTIKRFIEFNLNEMAGTVETYLLNALTALDFGFSVTEPCYKKIDYGEFEGLIGLSKLKVISPEQIEFETDAFGNLSDDGVIQMNQRMPANRFAIFTYRKEFENLYGTSDLREAYRPYFVKDTLIKFMAMALERFGQPIPVAQTAQTLDEAQKAQLLRVLQNLQAGSALVVPEWIKVTFEQPQPRTADAYVPALDLIDHWIAMAILMPSLIGAGGGQQKVGSLARSQTEFDTFLWVIGELRSELQEFINDRIIKVLVDLNYDVQDGLYPRFKFKELTHERKLEILDLYNKALQANAVTKTRDDEESYRSMAGFPELPEDEVAVGTRDAKEQELKDQVDQAGKMAKVAPAPGGGAKPFEQIVQHFHLPGEHDQADRGNRGGELGETAIKKGGFTYNPVRLKNRQAPKSGFAVAFDKSTEKVFSAKAGRTELKKRITEYVHKNKELIKEKGNYLGGWYDKASGKVFLDISKVLPSKDAAIKLAKEARQIAIFDLGKMKSIDVTPELRQAA